MGGGGEEPLLTLEQQGWEGCERCVLVGGTGEPF